MRKIRMIVMAIPYIIKCIKIVSVLKTKLDTNGDNKISIEEVKDFIEKLDIVPEQGE